MQPNKLRACFRRNSILIGSTGRGFASTGRRYIKDLEGSDPPELHRKFARLCVRDSGVASVFQWHSLLKECKSNDLQMVDTVHWQYSHPRNVNRTNVLTFDQILLFASVSSQWDVSVLAKVVFILARCSCPSVYTG